jgi:prepilin-type N-terminal cleavage/methylation domain-containing protein
MVLKLKKSNLRRGVTLLEIVVVLVIVATGAALAVPKLQKGAAQRRADSAIDFALNIPLCSTV